MRHFRSFVINFITDFLELAVIIDYLNLTFTAERHLYDKDQKKSMKARLKSQNIVD